jgi:hypothetical protein
MRSVSSAVKAGGVAPIGVVLYPSWGSIMASSEVGVGQAYVSIGVDI